MSKPMLLDDQVRHNKAVTVRLFMVVFLVVFLLVIAIAFALGVQLYFSLGLAVVIGGLYLAIASGASIPAILAASRARPANPMVREEKLLIYAVEEMAIAAGIQPPPKVYVQEDDDINAFAAGRNPQEAIVCATTGALRHLDQEELQGVIGHELAHVKNLDIRVTTYAIALIGLIALLAEIAIRSVFYGRGKREGGNLIMVLVVVALAILAPILSRMVYFAISRRREYLADSTGALLTRNPEGLARALEKIGAREPQPGKGDRTVASLYFDNPFRRLRQDSVFSTHPPIAERIRRLRQQ